MKNRKTETLFIFVCLVCLFLTSCGVRFVQVTNTPTPRATLRDVPTETLKPTSTPVPGCDHETFLTNLFDHLDLSYKHWNRWLNNVDDWSRGKLTDNKINSFQIARSKGLNTVLKNVRVDPCRDTHPELYDALANVIFARISVVMSFPNINETKRAMVELDRVNYIFLDEMDKVDPTLNDR